MGWLRRTASPPSSKEVSAPGPAIPEPFERGAPGIAEVLKSASGDGRHSVLDLGPAGGPSFGVYCRFARRIRFADLLSAATTGGSWSEALDAIPAQPRKPYDLIFAWDVIDRIGPEARPRLVEKLAALAAPDARLYVLGTSTDGSDVVPLRFELLGVDRVRCHPTGPPRRSWPGLLSAEMARLLRPFEVTKAFTLKVQAREYVAVRGGG